MTKAWPALLELEQQGEANASGANEARLPAVAPLKQQLVFESSEEGFLKRLADGEMQWVQEVSNDPSSSWIVMPDDRRAPKNGPESLPFKQRLFAQLDAASPSHVILASSSSALASSSFITTCTRDPSRILIGHPFNPPHLIPCVEVVPHPSTSPDITSRAMLFYSTTLTRRPILLHKEVPGHIGNRLQSALCHEAWSLVARGVVSAQDLDACVTTSLGLRWALTGPLLTNALGGGGGSEGFSKFMKHIGPAFVECKRDIDEQQERLGGWIDGDGGENDTSEAKTQAQKNVRAVETSVLDELSKMDADKLNEERVKELIRMIKSKRGSSQLV